MKLFEAAKTVDIRDIYERYCDKIKKIKKGKSSYAVKCPFHNDRNPSFNIYPNNTWYCFSCKESGTGVDLVMKAKGLDALEAAKLICKDFGVEYEDGVATYADSGNKTVEELTKQANALLDLNDYMAKVFVNFLQTAPNPKYFDDRGVGSLKASHQLGYCPGKPLFKDIEKGKEYGLCDDKGVCVFHDRYIIPIVSFSERVIGFIGRATPEAEAAGAPKYLISANNLIFQKRKVFYNPNGLRTKDDGVYVVEGVFDALAMIASGIENVVCPFGNSLSDQQLEAFRKHGKDLICAFDADQSGKEAKWKLFRYAKGIKVLTPVGDMQGCKDAGEIAEKFGPEAVVDAYSSVQAAPDFLLEQMKAKGLFDTEDGQEKAWEYLAKVIGAEAQEFNAKYPINIGYTPMAFKRYWKRFYELALHE